MSGYNRWVIQHALLLLSLSGLWWSHLNHVIARATNGYQSFSLPTCDQELGHVRLSKP